MHNKLFDDIGRRAYKEYRDTHLLEKGYEQAKMLNKNWTELNDIQLVIVSPCVRTIDTASFIFQHQNTLMIAKDFLIEYPIGGEEICNRRKDITDLKYMYPRINFERYPNELVWTDTRETLTNLDNRIEKMLDWVSHRDEKNIAIVSHSSFIGQFKDKTIGDEDNSLLHCYPYKIKVNFNKNKKFISMTEIKD
jgi:broad specificity phosphatase PhoE